MNRITNSLFRFAIFAGVLGLGLIAFLGLLGIVGLAAPILIGAFAGVGGLVLFLWGGTRAIGHLLHGHDPAYQSWLKNNDPWFSTLPPPFRASESQQSPYVCARCNGDMWEPVGVCPSCGYGSSEMVCNNCGSTVTEPTKGAFKTTGVICPGCHNILKG